MKKVILPFNIHNNWNIIKKITFIFYFQYKNFIKIYIAVFEIKWWYCLKFEKLAIKLYSVYQVVTHKLPYKIYFVI